MRNRGKKLHKEEKKFKFQRRFLLNQQSPFHIVEAYKVLRTNLIFSLPIKGCKKILVTSSQPSDGKSINCINIAISFAQTGARVLIIDCDLRRPSIARMLNENAIPGISNVLVNLSRLEDVIRSTAYEGLEAIFSGDIPPNPAELIGDYKMRELLDTLALNYDYIFVDAPPVNTVTDASILSKYVDGVMVIARQNYTEKKAISEAVKQLSFAGAKILGLVFNAVEQNGKKYVGHKYSRYSRYE